MSLIKENGYTYCSDFSLIDLMLNSKHYWQFDLEGANATIELYEVVEKALIVLEKDQDGFVMMVEQAYIDKYSHNNEIEGTVESVKSLNQTVELIMQWIGMRTDTAVLITADHETGGLMLCDNQEEIDDSWKLLPNNSSQYYKYTTGDHTRTPVGLFTYGITPRFEEFTTYKSSSLIKNIETNQIIKKAILNQFE
jgi:alkaline phosphatase